MAVLDADVELLRANLEPRALEGKSGREISSRLITLTGLRSATRKKAEPGQRVAVRDVLCAMWGP